MATATTEPGSPKLPIRRNIALLSGAVAASSAMLQLMAAVAAISLDRVLEPGGLLGLGHRPGGTARVPGLFARGRLSLEATR